MYNNREKIRSGVKVFEISINLYIYNLSFVKYIFLDINSFIL